MGERIQLYKPPESLFRVNKVLMRDGIELEKGVLITEPWMEKNEELLNDYWSIWSAYPDIFLDTIKPSDSNF